MRNNKFKHIIPLKKDGYIEILNKEGDKLCDIYKDGYISDVYPRIVLSLGEKDEITKINLNFIRTYSKLL